MNLGSMILKFSSDKKPTVINNCTAAKMVQNCLSVSGFSTDAFNKSIYQGYNFNASYTITSNITLDSCMDFMKTLPQFIPPNKP